MPTYEENLYKNKGLRTIREWCLNCAEMPGEACYACFHQMFERTYQAQPPNWRE